MKKIIKSADCWPALIACLNPDIIEASPNDRLTFTVYLPETCTVRDMLKITFWFKGHDDLEEAEDGFGFCVKGFAKRDHLGSMLKALDEIPDRAGIVDTR